jgi:DNA (cytosine-5)-methyltransferase 1
MRTVAFCEIDPYCREVLRRHWPDVPCYEDVRSFAGVECDVICGGFPCQDISQSGSKRGLAGARSGLWREFSRLVGILRPRYVIVENVAALTFRGLLDVLGDLTRSGYDAEWRTIRASDVGAPHGRARIWIVANSAGIRLSGAWARRQPRLDQEKPFAEADGVVAAFQEGALPYVCRRHDGLSRKLDGLAIFSLGNTVLPQIAEDIGRAIMKAENCSDGDNCE